MESKKIYIVGAMLVGLGCLVIIVSWLMGDYYEVDGKREENYICRPTVQRIVLEAEQIDLQVVTGQDESIEINYDKSYMDKVTIEENGRNLTINIKKQIWDRISLFGAHHQLAKMVIKIPESLMPTLKIESEAGQVEVTDVSVDQLKINSSAMELMVDQVIASLVEIDVVAGKVKLTDSQVEKELAIKSQAGNVDLRNTFFGEVLNVNLTTGTFKGRLPGQITDYSIETERVIGESNIESANRPGKPLIKLAIDVGEVDIQFKEE